MKESLFRRAFVISPAQEYGNLTRLTVSDENKSTGSSIVIDQPHLYIAFTIVVLSWILYVPFLKLPLLPDDYRSFGLWSGILTCFILAQLSKESAVAAIFLMLILAAKYRQFQKRTEPIEAFMRFLRDEPRRSVFVQCSDYYFSEARRAAYLHLGEAEENFVYDKAGGDGHSATYCLPGHI